MLRWFILLLLFCFNLCGSSADFDVVVVGSGPISLLEALYHHHSGKRVLILEEAAEHGGAWKSIDICGVSHVDLGCHTIGQDSQVLDFLERYVGCKMVSMDKPHLPFDLTYSPNGFYPSRGCFEIVNNLVRLIGMTDIVTLLEHPLERVYVDSEQPIAVIKTKDKEFTASKIIVTPYTWINLDNVPSSYSQNNMKSKYKHLYLLLEDSTSPRFTYHCGILDGCSRMMNLSSFVGLERTGTQLIVFQIYKGEPLDLIKSYFDELKKGGFVDDSAKILKAESFVYEQANCNESLIYSVKNADLVFEMIDTGSIAYMNKFIPKWKQILQPFHIAISQASDFEVDISK